MFELLNFYSWLSASISTMDGSFLASLLFIYLSFYRFSFSNFFKRSNSCFSSRSFCLFFLNQYLMIPIRHAIRQRLRKKVNSTTDLYFISFSLLPLIDNRSFIVYYLMYSLRASSIYFIEIPSSSFLCTHFLYLFLI